MLFKILILFVKSAKPPNFSKTMEFVLNAQLLLTVSGVNLLKFVTNVKMDSTQKK